MWRGGRLVPSRADDFQNYLTFLPAMTVSDFPALELAVARTFTFSFFGFLVSLLPRFFSLDIFRPPERCRFGGMPGGSWLSEDQGCLD